MHPTIPTPLWRNYILLFGIIGMAGCDPLTGIDAEIFATESFDLFPVDSISIKLSTVRFDSVETGNEERLLVGFQQDDLFGTIMASPYFQVGLDTVLPIDPSTTFLIL